MTDAGAGVGASPLILGSDMAATADFSEFIDYDDDALAATDPFSHSIDLPSELGSKAFHPPLLSSSDAASTALGAGGLGTVDSPDSLQDSFRDSSSDSGSSKDTTGSSGQAAGDVTMMDGLEDLKEQWSSSFVNGEDPSFAFGTGLDETPDKFFDFDRASNSPGALSNGIALNAGSPAMPTFSASGAARPSTTPMKGKSQASRKRAHGPSNFPLTQPMNGLHMSGSREVSPLSQAMPSHHPSPSSMFDNSPSPTKPGEMPNPTPMPTVHNGYYPGPLDGMGNGFPLMNYPPHVMQQYAMFNMPTPAIRCQLVIQPTPAKSRVETQIPIKLSLIGAPPMIKRLHLPTYTISKPKLLAKPPVERSPDMLELYTQLVCTSAMSDPAKQKRALQRAAAASHPPLPDAEGKDEATPENPDDKPQNGGEVRICAGCITRERKRAGRKKIKKFEEEEKWQSDESRRVIVFNTQEVKEWQPAPSPDPSKQSAQALPPGTMQVDAPMRIACYCRHHSEKMGFQVIFTIKDCQDRFVAQAISPSIMITDDHKTHPVLPPTLNSAGTQESDNSLLSMNGPIEGSSPHASSSFRPSQAVGDSQNISLNQTPTGKAQASTMSASALPRPVSPSNQGPAPKKRKASGSRVPIEMAMTRLDDSPPPGAQTAPASQASASAATSPFSPNLPNFAPSDGMFTPGAVATNLQPGFANGATTPNGRDTSMLYTNAGRSASLDNMAMAMFSAPNSTHGSRAPSPNTFRQSVGLPPVNPMAQSMVNGMSFIPAAAGVSGQPIAQPVIHKIIPGEGPKMGGIEVTILGSGFAQGLVVYFGENKATTTTFWGQMSLCCLLPPAASAGVVPVTVRQEGGPPSQPFTPNPNQVFHYVDNEESDLAKMMLSMISQKMTGHILSVRELATRIMTSSEADWNNLGNGGQGSANGFGRNNYTSSMESQLLKCLELIDLDDSSRMPRLDIKRATTGQSMLHLGCSLGYHRFVAGLLARGANPDLRDKGGFTPMHMAALNDHEVIVRRLMQAGADPTIRSLSGLRPADLARSRKVVEHIRRCERHVRSRSGGSLHSRANSAASLRSLWDNHAMSESDPASDGEESPEYSSGDYEDDTDGGDDTWLDMTRRASHSPSTAAGQMNSIVQDRGHLPAEPQSPSTAAIAAFSDVAAQLQHQFQQMQLQFRNFGQMTNLPQMPGLPRMPNYQAYLEQYHLMDRMTAFIPNVSGSRPGSADDEHPKTENGKWWGISALLNKDAPPAYAELFPRSSEAFDKKQASAAQAAAETEADAKCSKLYDTETTGAVVVAEEEAEEEETEEDSDAKSQTLRIGRKAAITKEQQQDFLRVHAEKFKGMSSDKNLWFIWIPLLTLTLAAMLYNRFPGFFSMVWASLASLFAAERTPSQTTSGPEARVIQAL